MNKCGEDRLKGFEGYSAQKPKDAGGFSVLSGLAEASPQHVDEDGGDDEDRDAEDEEADPAFKDGTACEDETTDVKACRGQCEGEGEAEWGAEQTESVVLNAKRNPRSEADDRDNAELIAHGEIAEPFEAMAEETVEDFVCRACCDKMGPDDVDGGCRNGDRAGLPRCSPDDPGENQ